MRANDLSFSRQNMSTQYLYPLDYGSSTCKAHDTNVGPCQFQNVSFCSDLWCYVDPNCPLGQVSDLWHISGGGRLSFSYTACGGNGTGAGQCRQNLPMVLMYVELVFLLLFTMELVIKSFVLRMFYVQSAWNIIDILCVLSGWLSFMPGMPNFSLLRVLKALRPLRMVNRVGSVRDLVDAVVNSVGALIQVALLLIFLLFVYAILGLVVLMGSMHGPNRLSSDRLSFDDLGSAMILLFQTLTMDGWSGILYDVQAGNNNTFVRLYFVAFIFIGPMYFMNIALAVVTNYYSEGKNGSSGSTRYIGHNYIGYKYIGHKYIGHNYIGRNYIGYDYIRFIWPSWLAHEGSSAVVAK